MGYDAAALSALLGQGTSKGPDPLSADEPARMFAPELSDEQKKDLVIRAYKKLKASFAEFNSPAGDKNTPAKTCGELKTLHPDKPSGEYWIDPNSADPKDAILAYCNMETGATCVQPKPSLSREYNIIAEEKELWIGDMATDAFVINYKADSNQMSFLQLLSAKAEQEVTYHCRNSVAFENPRGKNVKSLSFMSWNDLEIRSRGKFKYEVVSDGCKERADSWAKTVFKMESTKPTRLPVVDVKVEDFGTANQFFKVEVGQVCFT